MDSIWTDRIELPHFERLEGDKKTDVLIIGGGMAGILCAWHLQQAGVDYCLVEADTICSGITKNTTAKITSQHGLIYQKLIKEFDMEMAGLYLRANEMAIEQYRRICQNIKCDFEEKDAYVYSTRSELLLERELEALRKIGYPSELVSETGLPMPIKGAVKFAHQAQFHPLKFAAGVAKALNIYEHTKVMELGKHMAKTEYGEITAKNIIVATHFPMNNKHGMYYLKMYQSRSYVLALEGADQVHGMYIDEKENGLSFRNYGEWLLLGGGGHRTGKKGGGFSALLEAAKTYYPNAKVYRQFATQDCMTLDQVPYIGKYGSHTEGLYVAAGFNKWGMTTSMIAAMVLKDQILDGESMYAKLYNPQRTMMRTQLWLNAAEATANLLSFGKKRCPHMGCTLKWNAEESTWDCPCHGSRFEKNGEVIDNPASDDLKS